MSLIELITLAYFVYVVGYTAFFSLAAYFYQQPKFLLPFSYSRYAHDKFCILIPSYKEDAVIVETAIYAVSQNYPPECFEVVVIADSLQPSTLFSLRQLPIRVEE